jgi:hypothetical protein
MDITAGQVIAGLVLCGLVIFVAYIARGPARKDIKEIKERVGKDLNDLKDRLDNIVK